MEILGIQFAPLNVPLERRLQTLAAAAWFVTMAFGGFIGSLLLIYLFFTSLRYFVVLYLTFILVFDREVAYRGGRSITWVRNWTWWKYFRDYFPLNVERVPWVELDPKKNYLFCCFPHGMLSCGTFNAFGTDVGGGRDLFPHHQFSIVTLSQHYHMPFFRELALSLGGIASSADAIEHVLKTPGGGRICVLMPGGAAEAYFCRPGHYEVILKRRKGFIRLALQNGTPLVPVISFGETDLFNQVEGSTLRKIQESIRKLVGLAPVIPVGRGFFQYSFGIIPQRRRVTTVVGRPIEFEKIETPTKEEIDKLHKVFCEKLVELFEKQKHTYLEKPEDKHLVIC